MRAWKIANIANDIEPLEVTGDEKADTLVLGWGSTYGSITQAVNRLNEKGVKIASAHLTFVNPFPDNTQDILSKYKKVIIPELNTGQLIKLVRERYLIDAIGINKVNAEPFTAQELAEGIEKKINE
jgi:2-oxoglutarate ferredoxin oxidoreductase subunit alpha